MRVSDSGCYQLLLHLEHGVELTVGRLGKVRFAAGYYVYTGSARRGLSHRLRRHARRDKPLHWHIDYLTAVATVVGHQTFELDPARPEQECELHRALASREGVTEPVRGFGSSDCRCRSHLARIRDADQFSEHGSS